MVVSTALNLVFVPVIYVALTMLRERLAGGLESAHAVPNGHGYGAPPDGPRVIGWMEITDGDRREWKPVFETPVGEKREI